MRRVFFILMMSVVPFALRAQSADELWRQGNEAYANGDFRKAVELYDAVIKFGGVNERVYYNLGNAHFKEGNIAQSILFYKRALRLSPNDDDIRFNLAVAGGYVRDRVEVMPEFFLLTFIRSLRIALSSNGWALASLALFFTGLGLLLLFTHMEALSIRKPGFYGAMICAALFSVSLCFSLVQRKDIVNSNEAVIISASVVVKSSPDNTGKDLFILHEGTSVKVVNQIGDWREIMISNGNKGWVDIRTIEIV